MQEPSRRRGRAITSKESGNGEDSYTPVRQKLKCFGEGEDDTRKTSPSAKRTLAERYLQLPGHGLTKLNPWSASNADRKARWEQVHVKHALDPNSVHTSRTIDGTSSPASRRERIVGDRPVTRPSGLETFPLVKRGKTPTGTTVVVAGERTYFCHVQPEGGELSKNFWVGGVADNTRAPNKAAQSPAREAKGAICCGSPAPHGERGSAAVELS